MPTLTSTSKVVSTQRPLLSRPRILLVDTETRDSEFYAQDLRAQGFEVRVCSSYEEGERCLKSEKYDLVIVDQGSPAFEGRVVIERSVQKDRRVPVLVVTRYHDIASYIEAMQLGAVDYLEKPMAPDRLMRTIMTHLPPSWGLTLELT